MKTFNRALSTLAILPIAGIIALGGAGAANAAECGEGFAAINGSEVCSPIPEFHVVEGDNAGAAPAAEIPLDQEPAPVEFVEPEAKPGDSPDPVAPYVNPATGGTVSLQPDGNYVDSATGFIVSPEAAAAASGSANGTAEAEASKDAGCTLEECEAAQEKVEQLSADKTASEPSLTEIAVFVGTALVVGIAGVVLYLKRSAIAGLGIFRGRYGKS